MKITDVPTVNGVPQSAPQPVVQRSSDRERAVKAMTTMMNQSPTADTAHSVPVEANPTLSATEDAPPKASEATSPEAAPKATDEAKVDEPLSSQYAMLARKEKAFRHKQMEFKAEMEAFQKSKESSGSAPSPQSSFDESKYIAKDTLASDPITALLNAGISYDKITEMMLNQDSQKTDPRTMSMIDELKAEIKSLKGEQENTKKGLEDQRTRAYQEAITKLTSDTQALVENNPEYEMIAATDSYGDVVELIEAEYKENKRYLTVEQAAKEIENYLVEEASKLARLNKIQSKLKPAATPAASATPPSQAGEKPKQTTLTNSMNSAPKLSARERAIQAALGNKAS